jgi:hypothetical protein
MGLAAVIATITSTNVLTLGFAFSPSQPPTRSRLMSGRGRWRLATAASARPSEPLVQFSRKRLSPE